MTLDGDSNWHHMTVTPPSQSEWSIYSVAAFVYNTRQKYDDSEEYSSPYELYTEIGEVRPPIVDVYNCDCVLRRANCVVVKRSIGLLMTSRIRLDASAVGRCV